MPPDGAAAPVAAVTEPDIRRVDLSRIDNKTARKVLTDHEHIVRMEVAKAVRKRGLHRVVWMDRDDLAAHGRWAVLEAYASYDTTRTASLPTWITNIVRWRVREAAEKAVDPSGAIYVYYSTRKAARRGAATKEAVDRALDRYQSMLRLQFVSITAGAAGASYVETLPDHAPTPEDAAADRQARERVYRLIEMLDRRQQMILTAEMGGVSGAALSREIGVSRQRVNDQRKRALKALRAIAAPPDPRQVAREKLAREIFDRACIKLRAQRRLGAAQRRPAEAVAAE